MPKSMQNQVTLAWNNTLNREPAWMFSTDETSAIFDKTSMIGLSFDPSCGKFAVGHISADLKFLPAAGPFDSIIEATIALIGAVANYDAAAYYRR